MLEKNLEKTYNGALQFCSRVSEISAYLGDKSKEC